MCKEATSGGNAEKRSNPTSQTGDGLPRYKRVWRWFLGKIKAWDPYAAFITACATTVIAAFTIELYCVSHRQWRTMQQQLAESERPVVVPSTYVFNGCGKKPFVWLGNYGPKPGVIHTWIGQQVSADASLEKSGPTVLKRQPTTKIVLFSADQHGEMIEFDDFQKTPTGSSCYLSGLIEYKFLDRYRYCTRFCRYVTLPSLTEHACTDPATNDLKEGKDCDQYHASLSDP